MTKTQLLQLIETGKFYHTKLYGGREWLACNACHQITSLHGHADDCIRGKYEREQAENSRRAVLGQNK